MFIKECESYKIIEKEMNFKFSELELIGYTNMYFDVAIYKNDKKIYSFELYKNKIVSIFEVGNGRATAGFLYNEKMYSFKYKRRVIMYKNTIEIKNNGKSKIIETNDEDLRIGDEEIVIFKLCEHFLNEEKILENEYITVE